MESQRYRHEIRSPGNSAADQRIYQHKRRRKIKPIFFKRLLLHCGQEFDTDNAIGYRYYKNKNIVDRVYIHYVPLP